MICAEHGHHAVLASVHGWDAPYWVDCHGALSVRDLTNLILDGFARQVPVWLPPDGAPRLCWGGRVVDPSLRVVEAIPNGARVFVHI
jgi:hypothetical protein